MAAPDAQVRYYQDILAYLAGRGLFALPAGFTRDGLLGAKTAAAVSAFQRVETQRGHPLAVTGALDAPTKAMLDLAADAAQNAGFVRVASQTIVPRATGSNPAVTAIATRTGPVPVAESVSKMIPPSSVEALQQMPADKVSAFLADLQTKAADIAAAQESGASDGTGKGTTADISAVPMVAPDGTVTSALAVTQTQPSWWDGLSSGQKVAVGVGAGVVGLGLIAAVVSMASGGRQDNPGRRRRR